MRSAVVLTFLSILFFCGAVYAECSRTIKSMDDFLEYYNVPTEVSCDIDLQCDLDFKDVETPYPLGIKVVTPYVYFYFYNSVFNGNGHTIKNLVISGYYGSLFYCIGTATVKDLYFDSSCRFEGVYAAALAIHYTNYNTYIYNVSSAATIYASDIGAGIVAFTPQRNNALLMKDCVNTGDVIVTTTSSSQSLYAGGLVGNTSGSILMINCHNYGTVSLDYEAIPSNTTDYTFAAGGLIGTAVYEKDDMERYSRSIRIQECSNHGSVSMALNADPAGANASVGGLIGLANGAVSGLTVNIANSTNTGDVSLQTIFQDVTMRAGGIVGGVINVSGSIESCFNYGEIYSATNCNSCLVDVVAAGLTGANILLPSGNISVVSSMNKANVFSPNTAVGMAYDCVAIRNSVNSGNVSGSKVSYGIAWKAKTVDSVASKGYTTCRGNDCSYATLNGTNVETWESLFFLEGLEGAGTAMTIDPVSNRYVVGPGYRDSGDDVADIMNGHGHSSGWLWWSGGLEPGYRIVIMNDDLPSAMTRRVFVAEYGETFDEALTREDKAIADFMHDGFCSFQHENKGSPISFNESIVRDMNITVRSVKHVLHFVYTADSLDISINVIHSELPSISQLSAVKKYMKDDSYAIVEVVNGSNTKIPFNISAAVTEDKEYSIVKLGGVVIIIDLSITNMSNDEIVAAVEELLGDSALSVEVEVEGGELRITVIINEDDTLDVVNELSSTDDERLRDIVRRVYAIGKPESLEISSGLVSTVSSISLFLMCVVFFTSYITDCGIGLCCF